MRTTSETAVKASGTKEMPLFFEALYTFSLIILSVVMKEAGMGMGSVVMAASSFLMAVATLASIARKLKDR